MKRTATIIFVVVMMVKSGAYVVKQTANGRVLGQRFGMAARRDSERSKQDDAEPATAGDHLNRAVADFRALPSEPHALSISARHWSRCACSFFS